MGQIDCRECEHHAFTRTGGSRCVKRGFDIYNVEYGSCLDFKQKENKPMDVIGRIGTPAALEQLAEECAELGHAALKLARKLRGENPTPKTYDDCMKDFNEEVADVMVCLESLVNSGFISNESIESVIVLKERRWEDRLDGKE